MGRKEKENVRIPEKDLNSNIIYNILYNTGKLSPTS